MKILHIIPTLHGGGAEKFCIDLCNELSINHDVTICTLFPITEEMFMAKALDPKIHLISLDKKLGLDLSIFFKIYYLIKNRKYDIVNTHLRALSYCDLGAIFTKTRFFHTVHNMADKETSKINRFHYSILFHFFEVTPIGISHEVSRSIQSEYGDQFNILIENGVKRPEVTPEIDNIRREITSYKKTADTKVFLTIGRIAPQKNQKMLIEVFNQLINEGEDVSLLIIGDDPDLTKPLLTQLKIIAKKYIHFLGMKQNIADYLLCADAFCLSSLYEGLPITLLESMSLGVIPICTPVGGIVDVIQNEVNGILANDTSERSYYKAIKYFLSLPKDQTRQISQNELTNFLANYDISMTAKNYINTYKTNK